MTETKVCKKCGRVLPMTVFRKRRYVTKSGEVKYYRANLCSRCGGQNKGALTHCIKCGEPLTGKRAKYCKKCADEQIRLCSIAYFHNNREKIRRQCCSIIKKHHEKMQHDPEHLTTEFIRKIVHCDCDGD